MTFTCLVCRTTEELVAAADGTPPVDPANELLRCDTCKTLLAYGTPMPRVVIEPASDERFVVLRIGETILILEKSFARALGRNLTSIT